MYNMSFTFFFLNDVNFNNILIIVVRYHNEIKILKSFNIPKHSIFLKFNIKIQHSKL